jgi:putative PIN family toxin of toxin-antitoxin system
LSRYVLDANIVLSAFVGRPAAPPALLLAGIHNGDLEAVACPLLIEEVRETLAEPYFRSLLSELEAREAIEAYSDLALMLQNPTDIESVLRDPEDDYLVALARISGAKAIITGDKDLLDHLDLHPQAIEARAACELLGLVGREG